MNPPRPIPPATRTEPTRWLCPPPGKPVHPYVPAAETDIRKTWRQAELGGRNA